MELGLLGSIFPRLEPHGVHFSRSACISPVHFFARALAHVGYAGNVFVQRLRTRISHVVSLQESKRVSFDGADGTVANVGNKQDEVDEREKGVF